MAFPCDYALRMRLFERVGRVWGEVQESKFNACDTSPLPPNRLMETKGPELDDRKLHTIDLGDVPTFLGYETPQNCSYALWSEMNTYLPHFVT